MRQLFSKDDVHAISWVLAVVLLVSSLPLSSGIVIISGPSQPEFTINICQPLQVLSNAPVIPLARNTAIFINFVPPRDWGPVAATSSALSNLRVPPDTPPPKFFT